MRDRLEDLLVAPAELPRLLVQVVGRDAIGVEGCLQVVEQRRLLCIPGAEAARPRYLVEAEAGAPRRLRVLGDAVGVVAMLGNRQGTPLAGRLRQDPAAQLGAHPGVRPQHGRGAGEDADELGHRAAGRLDALDQGSTLVGGRQLVVDLKSAYCRFYRHLHPAFGSVLRNSAPQSLYVAFTLL